LVVRSQTHLASTSLHSAEILDHDFAVLIGYLRG
jgi:hypothetical protein